MLEKNFVHTFPNFSQINSKTTYLVGQTFLSVTKILAKRSNKNV